MTRKVLKVGGEFEINPNLLHGLRDFKLTNNTFLYSSGRSALMAILQHLNNTKEPVIHIPFYICNSVIKACENANFQVKFYELNDDFLLPLDYLKSIKNEEVLLTVNYFGFVDDNPTITCVKELRQDITVISDQVQSFWTYDKTKADYSFTSLRKHFPIPEGALIYSKDKRFFFDINMKLSSFYKNKFIGSILKYQNLSDDVYLKFFEDGEQELDNEHMFSKASELAHYLYKELDFAFVKKRRKENYNLVYELGHQYELDFMFPYKESVIPLNIPIYVKNRNQIRKALMEKSIFLPIHWIQDDYNKSSALVKSIGTNELSLIIDQRYSLKEIKFEIESLINVIKYG